MNHIFKLKPFIISLLLLLLAVPLNLIDDLISERQQRSKEVHQDIADSSSTAQQLIGPFIVLETEQFKEELIGHQLVVKAQNSSKLLLPTDLKMQTQLQSEIRSRGIYQSRLYHTQNQLDLVFNLPKDLGLENTAELSAPPKAGAIRLKSARLVLALSDVRGLMGMPGFILQHQQLQLMPGTGLNQLDGVHARLDVPLLLAQQQFKLQVKLNLSGTNSLSVLPLADNSSWQLTADWPHPGFRGRFLPQQRQLNNEGFSASWQSTLFANNLLPVLLECLYQAKCGPLKDHSFQVDLVDPVDQYQQANRAVKYALLVLVVSFAVFYLFELLAKLHIHPMQYLFVGLALAMFYLLLLSLSEVLGFALAYLIAAVSCVALIGSYTVAVLRSRQKGLIFSAGLLLLYSLLFMILRAEDMALLAGSLLLFMVLTALMLCTRHLDWYQMQTPGLTTAATDLPEQTKS
jgi:inner membrane protein